MKRRREHPTVLENSPPGDSRANGAAERAVQAIGEQVRVLRRALEDRLGARVPGSHPVTTWLVEHSADVLNKFQKGDDGRTAYHRLKGKPFNQSVVEFGEKVHYRIAQKGRLKENKLEVRWDEGHYLGMHWRTGEAVVDTPGGVVRAGTIRRVGAHRRWDAESLLKMVGAMETDAG